MTTKVTRAPDHQSKGRKCDFRGNLPGDATFTPRHVSS